MGTIKPEDGPKQELDDSGCIQDSSVSYRGQAELLDLSDDVLLCILKLCTPRDLKALGYTCPRLGTLICDRTLWQRVDARSQPIGEERLDWLLNHCLTTATQELKLAGYVNKESRCLGIQDLTNPNNAEPASARLDTNHVLLRMWYPHLPRYAMSPRWPDKREAAGKAYSKATEEVKQPLSPLSQLASVIFAGNAGPASSNSAGTNSSNSGLNSSDSDPNSNELNANLTDSLNDGSSCHGPQFTLNYGLLKRLRSNCSNLSSLSLEYCNLDYRTSNLRFFPSNLKKLSLKGTRCYNLPLNTSLLGKIQERLPDLEYLDISECEWFEPASLMPLSKLKKLEELHMRSCRKLTECVAYTSLATRYGFQKLKVLDVRGSPVADSEVSAFGWLPVLEELYACPAPNIKFLEHTHKWDDVLAPFNELDSWEMEEPEHYICKSPTVEYMDEDEDMKEDGVGEERLGDMMIGNFVSCAAFERRIIVIHPNRPNQVINLEDDPAARPVIDPQIPSADPRPTAEQRRGSAPQPGPSNRNLKRPHPYSDLDFSNKRISQTSIVRLPYKRNRDSPNDSEPINLVSTVSRPDLDSSEPKTSQASGSELKASKDGSKPSVQWSSVKPSASDSLPSTSQSSSSKPSTSESASSKPGTSKSEIFEFHDSTSQTNISQPSASQSNIYQPSTSQSDVSQPSTSQSNSSESEPLPSRSKADDDENSTYMVQVANAATSTPKSKFELQSDRRSSEAIRRVFKRRRDDTDDSRQFAAKYEDNATPSLLNHARPPIANHARPLNQRARPNNDRPNLRGGESLDAFILDCPDAQMRGLAPLARIEVDLHLPRGVTTRDIHYMGFHLVSDSAVARFGRAENDHINYINIGHNYNTNDPGVRPDRSNLRVLSITGYRNITDRSLEHLATAAPHLRRIDFSCSSVTERGVEVFKAIRPNCEVIFSEFKCDFH